MNNVQRIHAILSANSIKNSWILWVWKKTLFVFWFNEILINSGKNSCLLFSGQQISIEDTFFSVCVRRSVSIRYACIFFWFLKKIFKQMLKKAWSMWIKWYFWHKSRWPIHANWALPLVYFLIAAHKRRWLTNHSSLTLFLSFSLFFCHSTQASIVLTTTIYSYVYMYSFDWFIITNKHHCD